MTEDETRAGDHIAAAAGDQATDRAADLLASEGVDDTAADGPVTREGRGRHDDLTHVNAQGRARMVDVGAKARTHRSARAAAKVLMAPATLELVRTGGVKKGDVLAVAQVAGIMAAKRTWELVPMCHQLRLTAVDISFAYEPDGIALEATCRCKGETGVEMEALTAASVAALTIYDMCKAVQRDMVITEVMLLEKEGGRSGHFLRGDL